MARTSSSGIVADPRAASGELAPRAAGRSVATNLLITLRPDQWTKNLLVFAGLLFGQRLFDPWAVLAALAAFAIFCALSGTVYLINDVIDRENDRQHPLKSRRPVASGALPIGTALSASAIIGSAAIAGSFVLSRPFVVVAVSYVALLVVYSAVLKHVVIIDVLTIAIGFVLRAVAGAVAVSVGISHWLLVCTVLLALFVALAKRRHELVLLADAATSHRRILSEYSPYLLDQMISVVTASTLLSYMFYTIS